jgi:hypothetical protein
MIGLRRIGFAVLNGSGFRPKSHEDAESFSEYRFESMASTVTN